MLSVLFDTGSVQFLWRSLMWPWTHLPILTRCLHENPWKSMERPALASIGLELGPSIFLQMQWFAFINYLKACARYSDQINLIGKCYWIDSGSKPNLILGPKLWEHLVYAFFLSQKTTNHTIIYFMPFVFLEIGSVFYQMDLKERSKKVLWVLFHGPHWFTCKLT